MDADADQLREANKHRHVGRPRPKEEFLGQSGFVKSTGAESMHNTEYDLSIGPFVVVPRAMFSSTSPSKGLEMGFLWSRSHSEGSANVRFGSISLSLAKLTLGQVARWFARIATFGWAAGVSLDPPHF